MLQFWRNLSEISRRLGCQAYKIASPEINDIELIRTVSKTKKPIFFSTGMANLNDIVLAVKNIKKFHNNYAILKCTSKYPAKFDELNLNSIKFLKKKFKCAVGFSDHTNGNAAAVAAVLNGATIIEKHFKSDDDKKSVDRHFSMKISNFKNFKNDLTGIKKDEVRQKHLYLMIKFIIQEKINLCIKKS